MVPYGEFENVRTRGCRWDGLGSERVLYRRSFYVHFLSPLRFHELYDAIIVC